MNREEKIKLAIEKGYTCDPITGKVYGVRGKELQPDTRGYITITKLCKDDKYYWVSGHHFIYYWTYKKIVEKPVLLDHINGVRNDNRIENLREVSYQQNSFNTKAKGYTWDNLAKKWRSQICIDGKTKNIGRFHTEQEAKQAYLDAKKIYHII